MESLRPERDELDRFNSRQSKPVKKKTVAKQQKTSKSSSILVSLLLMVLVGASGFLAWAYLEQQSELKALQKELRDATSFIGQSKLLMARFEGELSETGAEMLESGSEVEKKLAFLDSEMRKLWGVSNDRNKKLIKNNATSISVLEERNARLTKSQEALVKDYDQKVAGVEQKIAQLESMATVAASEVAVTREAINEEIASVKLSVASVDKYGAQITENKSAISSIDASRRQLNERIVKLEEELNSLRLKLSNSRLEPAKASNAIVEAQ